VENQKNAIDLDGWFNHQETQDDDDGIDDNAVNDSAIAINSDVRKFESFSTPLFFSKCLTRDHKIFVNFGQLSFFQRAHCLHQFLN